MSVGRKVWSEVCIRRWCCVGGGMKETWCRSGQPAIV